MLWDMLAAGLSVLELDNMLTTLWDMLAAGLSVLELDNMAHHTVRYARCWTECVRAW